MGWNLAKGVCSVNQRRKLPNRALQVDWWSLGITLYVMLVGYPPFHGDSPQAIFANILAGDLQFPSDLYLSQEVKHLITELLAAKP